ncbi:MAG: ATP-dependent helicase [Candidatus Levybacteria bacterium]|nr:ATP-dependent helicase [Candidatus Levybacteria bacterium]
MPDLVNLNPEQKEAITHGDGPLMIIAGAGTGKTTVVTKRIEHLILEKKVNASNILALTFTEKAASEMEKRIDEILPYGYTNLWIETFHAFCDRVLRQEAIHIGLTPSYELMTETEAILFLKKTLFDFDLVYFRPMGNPMKFIQGMLSHFSRLKDDDINPTQYLAYAEKLKTNEDIEEVEVQKTFELAYAFEKYEFLKNQAGVMDFSDLISNVLTLFRKRPNILSKYQEQFTYILVDEFQDTNYSQNEMAILLSGEKKNITVVGDDDQSIYRWRGAALSNMLQFRSHFPKAKIVTLNKNYRSTQIILDGAYKMIQNNNPDRLEAKEGIEKKLIALRAQKGKQIEFLYKTRVEDEAEAVAKYIKNEVKKNGLLYKDFAILVRANNHATPFQRALEREKIPCQFLGPSHLFEQNEIRDLIAYLKILANYDDNASFYRVLTMPIFNIQARDIATLLNYVRKNNCTLLEAIEQNGAIGMTEDGFKKIKRVEEILKKHLQLLSTESAGQILYYFFEDSGLLGYYLDPKTSQTEHQAQNVAKFFTKLQSFASNNTDASVFAVVDWIELSMELGESPLAAEIDWSTSNAVNVLTVHSSKGLEFPVVFVTNLVTQRFPSRDRKEQIPVPTDIIREVLPIGDENLQEERRLFYVAMTRAKDQLILTAAKYYGEGKKERKLSPFIGEALGEEYVANIISKQKTIDSSQQLSLLELFNSNHVDEKTVEEIPQPTISPITYLSYSQIQTFDTCPLHYKLKYILNVPTAPSPALSYGISVHSTLRDFFQLIKSGIKINPDSIHDLLIKNWIKTGYVSKGHEEKARNQADLMLQNYAKKILADIPNTIAIEQPFNFRLEKLKIGGRIDRIDKLSDGKIEIIDYKTGANIPTEKKAREDFQLTFYALAANQVRDNIFNKLPEEVLLSLYYIEEDKKISTIRTSEDLELAKQTILKKANEIQHSNFLCNGGILCKNCEYKMICSLSTD